MESRLPTSRLKPLPGMPRATGEHPDLRDVGQALGELRLLQQLNQAIIANLPSGIAVLDQDGRLLYFNGTFGRMWDLDLAALGKHLAEVAGDGPLSRINWRGEVARLIEGGQALPGNLLEAGERPSRRVIRYGLFSLPPTDFDLPRRLVGDEFCLGFLSQHECIGDCQECCAHTATWQGDHALLLVEDITDQRQLEAQLTQSEKLAALGQLSAGVAHEIRNPLSAIYNAAFYIADVLSDEEPDVGELQEYVALIQRNVDRAQRTVTNILNFARPSGPDRTTADLSDLVEQTLAILDKALVDQGVALERHLRSGVMVRCRPETVKQALLNLIVNALQAMPEGGTLIVATAREDGDFPSVLVTDTGSGIAAGDLSRIFNPFYSTKPAGQGTGLGLSIARQAIEADGGRLDVASELGRGTTFEMALPAAH
ncbi:MAG: hypothetical protein HZB16_06400 [Armatimonadetes bacterium]|nr:hypothetical protein [Armatimonadota bacterium]